MKDKIRKYKIFKEKDSWRIKRKSDGAILDGSFTSEVSARRYTKNVLRDDMFQKTEPIDEANNERI